MLRIFVRLVFFAALLSVGSVLGACSKDDKVYDDLADAREYMRHRDFIEAEKSFERYLRRNADGQYRWEVWNHLVDLALNVRHNRNAAIELLEAMTIEYSAKGEERRMVLERLAAEYENVRRYDRAIELWRSLLEPDAGTPDLHKAAIYRNLARVSLRRLEFDTARESLSLCLKLDIPQSMKSDCQYDLADAYMVMGNLEASIAELNKLLELDGVDDELRVLAIFMLADVLEQEGNKKEALKLFESIRFSYPNGSVVEIRIEYLKNSNRK